MIEVTLNFACLLVPVRWSEIVIISELLGFSHTKISMVYRGWSEKETRSIEQQQKTTLGSTAVC